MPPSAAWDELNQLLQETLPDPETLERLKRKAWASALQESTSTPVGDVSPDDIAHQEPAVQATFLGALVQDIPSLRKKLRTLGLDEVLAAGTRPVNMSAPPQEVAPDEPVGRGAAASSGRRKRTPVAFEPSRRHHGPELIMSFLVIGVLAGVLTFVIGSVQRKSGKVTLQTTLRWAQSSARQRSSGAGGAQPSVPPTEDSRTGILWVYIPEGSFAMGSETGQNDEKPVHEVFLEPFRMSKTEVTVAQYRICVEAGACKPPASREHHSSCNWGYPDRDAFPVNCVDWHQAKAYASFASARLPTEAEWEYAARGASGRTYPWGGESPTCELAVFSLGGEGCGQHRSFAVCSRQRGATPEGLCDMAGNVWEWVEDCYDDSYRNAPSDGTAAIRCTSQIGDVQTYVARGGSYFDVALGLKSTFRYWFWPASQFQDLGFRVVTSDSHKPK